MEEAGSHKNQTIANGQREREFAKCMGDDMSSSSAGFQSPASGSGKRGRGMDPEMDDEEVGDTLLESGY